MLMTTMSHLRTGWHMVACYPWCFLKELDIMLIGEQPFETLCGMLRQTYQRNVELLRSLDDSVFQPSEYVYERTKAVIEHC